LPYSYFLSVCYSMKNTMSMKMISPCTNTRRLYHVHGFLGKTHEVHVMSMDYIEKFTVSISFP